MTAEDAKNMLNARYRQVGPFLNRLKPGLMEAWRRVRSAVRARPRVALGIGGLLLVTLIALTGGGGGIDDPRDALSLCIEALREGDFSEMEPVFLTASDVRDVLKDMPEEQRTRAMEEMQSKGGIESIVAHEQNRLRESFERVRREAECRFSWKDMELSGVQIEPRKGEEGPPQADVTAVLDHEGRRYTLVARQSKTPRGWVCERLRLRAP